MNLAIIVNVIQNLFFNCDFCRTTIIFLKKVFTPIKIFNKEVKDGEEYGLKLTGTKYVLSCN